MSGECTFLPITARFERRFVRERTDCVRFAAHTRAPMDLCGDQIIPLSAA